jgi:hypothetical protein
MDYFQQNNNNTISSPAEFITIFSEQIQQLLSILDLTTKNSIKRAKIHRKENYFVILFELGQNLNHLSLELYESTYTLKYTTKKLLHLINPTPASSKINRYYELCNKVYQMQSLINLGIEHFCEEKNSEDNVHILSHLKEQIQYIRLLLEISIIQFPQLYKDKKKSLQKISKKNDICPQML